jgi:hypothetical protein
MLNSYEKFLNSWLNPKANGKDVKSEFLMKNNLPKIDLTSYCPTSGPTVHGLRS